MKARIRRRDEYTEATSVASIEFPDRIVDVIGPDPHSRMQTRIWLPRGEYAVFTHALEFLDPATQSLLDLLLTPDQSPDPHGADEDYVIPF